MTIESGMPRYPASWHPYPEVTMLASHGAEGRETRRIVMGTHTGTHVDAPRHFVPNGKTIDNLNLDIFVGLACVLDFHYVSPNQAINAGMVRNSLGDRYPERVLFNFAWEENKDSPSYYSGCPYLTEDAVDFLLDNGCRLIGLDTPMPDNPHDSSMPIHKKLLGNNVPIVEGLVNLQSLVEYNSFMLVVAPLKVREGDGAPARVFATVND
jgi:kynurenine formamidase